MGACQFKRRDLHVLVAGEENVEVKVPHDPAGDVLRRVGELLPGLQVLLEAPVVDRDGEVAPLFLHRGENLLQGFLRLCDVKVPEVFGKLPDIYPVRHGGGDADPKAVFHRVDDIRNDRKLSLFVPHIGADALRVQGVQIRFDVLIPEVEVMVSQREIGEAAGVEGLGNGMVRIVPLMGEVVGRKGRSLEGVAAVEDQGVLFCLSRKVRILFQVL